MNKPIITLILMLTAIASVADDTKQKRVSFEQCKVAEKLVVATQAKFDKLARQIRYDKDELKGLERQLKADEGTINNNIDDCENLGQGCSFIKGKVERYENNYENYTNLFDNTKTLISQAKKTYKESQRLSNNYYNDCAAYILVKRATAQ